MAPVRLLSLLMLAAALGACSAAPAPPGPPAAPTAVPTTAATAVPTAAATAAATDVPVATPVPTAQPQPGGRVGAPPAPADPPSIVDLYAAPAPEFPTGLQWLNIDAPLTLAELRGKIVVIDFWTYGCINCVHNFPDLEHLQRDYPNELVVIGVHSAKFTTEADTENIRQTLLRYQIDYPVVNDDKKQFWDLYNAQAWPTTVLIDTSGVLASQHLGEGAYAALKPEIVALLQEARARGRLDLTPINRRLESEGRPQTVLSFPGKVLADGEHNRLFISDSGHNRIVVADPSSGEVLQVIGSGQAGLADGALRDAAFDNPQGMAVTPDGGTLYVADPGNHAVRAVDLAAGRVTTIAGTGKRSLSYPPLAGPAAGAALSSPWDLALRGSQLYIAMAGSHQIWQLNLAAGTLAPLAGSAREGVRDGPAAEADLAQPGGLAYDGNGRLYIADTESSTVRYVQLGGAPQVVTLAGGVTSLFAFGDADGVGHDARFQHPQGIAYAQGALFVADTYNNKIRRVDPATGQVRTLAGGERGWRDGPQPLLYEPAGISAAGGTLYVADTNNHAIRTIDAASGQAGTIVLQGIERFAPAPGQAGLGPSVITMPTANLRAGEGLVQLDITLPPGYKVNDLAPSSVRWSVEGQALALPGDADRSLAGMHFPLQLAGTFRPGAGTLTADVGLIYCEANTPKLCLIEDVRIVAPFVVGDSGEQTLRLRHTVVLAPLTQG